MDAAAAFLTPQLTSRTSTPNSSDPTSTRLAKQRKGWTVGDLWWLLNSDQRKVYWQYRKWEERDPETEPGQFPRVFVFDIGRRWGKTTTLLIILFENALRNPGRRYRYATAYYKYIKGIIADVYRYVGETCPADLKPRLIGHTFKFHNGSEISLVGLDVNPDGLRGLSSDGDVISEAAFVGGLLYSVQSVLYPQYQGRPWARLVLESSAPVEAESDYDEKFVEDAKLRGAWVYRTIEDNPMLSKASVSEFNRAAGGVWNEELQRWEGANCLRENYNIRVRDPEGSVVPEFSVARHVRVSAVPAYAHCYVGADPGTRDKFGLVFGYWDFERGKLVIQRSWAERNASLADVAEVIRDTECELWGSTGQFGYYDGENATPPEQPLQFWDGRELQQNPFRRVSDTDGATLVTLRKDHGIRFNGADKNHTKHAQDAGAARKIEQPKLYLLRQWLLNDLIEIWPDSGPLQHQLNAGRWNKQRTDFERTDAHGHLDCMMALVYLLPQIDRNANPEKPSWAGASPDTMHFPAHIRKEMKNPQTHAMKQLNKHFGRKTGFGNNTRFVR